jgi:glycosyltransferase involved in cell wall biosynthesis
MISILIPVYNGIEFLRESLGSVLQQDYYEWEVIIAVNGYERNSKTYQEAKSYVDKILEYNNTKWFKDSTIPEISIRVLDFHFAKGKAVTLNNMLDHCKGDYVAILDVDDIWLPQKLGVQSTLMGIYDVIGTKCVYFGDIEGVIPAIPVGDIQAYNFTRSNPVINSSALIRKELCCWEENGIEDYDLWLKLWKQGKSFYNIDTVLVKHRIHQQSAFNSKGNHLKVSDLLKKYI